MKRIILNALAVLLIGLTTLSLASPAYAACGNSSTSQGQALQGIGDTGGDCSGGGVNDVLSSVVNILSFIVGVAAVIMIIVGGLKFITAAGDSSKAAGARSTVAYALIGIAVAALAQVLVHFVLSASAGPPPKKKSIASPNVAPVATQQHIQSHLQSLPALGREP